TDHNWSAAHGGRRCLRVELTGELPGRAESRDGLTASIGDRYPTRLEIGRRVGKMISRLIEDPSPPCSRHMEAVRHRCEVAVDVGHAGAAPRTVLTANANRDQSRRRLASAVRPLFDSRY